MKRYVAGFLFNKEGNQVALIEKQRPEWQKFQLNGIGGHIENHTPGCIVHNPPPSFMSAVKEFTGDISFEPCNCAGETAAEAMRREFREETGVDIDRWKEYCILNGLDYEVHFFHAYGLEIHQTTTKTDEQVAVYGVDRILDPNISYPLIPNLRWLIPMALSIAYEPQVVKYHVQEVNPYV